MNIFELVCETVAIKDTGKCFATLTKFFELTNLSISQNEKWKYNYVPNVGDTYTVAAVFKADHYSFLNTEGDFTGSPETYEHTFVVLESEEHLVVYGFKSTDNIENMLTIL